MHGRAERLPESISQNARGVDGASGSEMTIQELEFDFTLSCDGGRSFCLPEESAIEDDVNVGTTIRGFPNCGSWLIPLKTIQPVTRKREPHIVLPPSAPQDVVECSVAPCPLDPGPQRTQLDGVSTWTKY
jgi:hypothetical protein